MGLMAKKGRALLVEKLGEGTVSQFERSDHINFYLPNPNKYRTSSFTVRRNARELIVYDDRMQLGTLPIEGRNIYDLLLAIVTNLENGTLSFGCGKLEMVLPDMMPPVKKDFMVYLMSRRPKWVYKAIRFLWRVSWLPATRWVLRAHVNTQYGGNSMDAQEGDQSIAAYLAGSLMVNMAICGYVAFILLNIQHGDFNGVILTIGYPTLAVLLDGMISVVVADYKIWKETEP